MNELENKKQEFIELVKNNGEAPNQVLAKYLSKYEDLVELRRTLSKHGRDLENQEAIDTFLPVMQRAIDWYNNNNK